MPDAQMVTSMVTTRGAGTLGEVMPNSDMPHLQRISETSEMNSS